MGGEEDGMEEQDEYSFGYSHSVEKRPRMSPDAEVVLDSGDEDDEPLPPSRLQSSTMPARQNNTLQKQQLMSHTQSNMYSQQAQLASQFQPRMPYSQQYLRPQVQAFNGANPLYASQQQVNVRKRKLPSSALCIKDGRVFMKSFTQLPDALLGDRSDNSNQDMQHSTQSAAPKPNTFNPYKTFASQDYRPRHPIEVYSSNIQHRDKATKSLIQGHETSGILQQRIRQLPPGIIVQKNQTRTESRGSVEDEEEYHSDEPEEIEGQEAEVDVIHEHSSKDDFSEEDDSGDEVNERNTISEEDQSIGSDNDHNASGNETDKEDQINSASCVDVDFGETSVDIQEAREENEKMHIQVNTNVETYPEVETCEQGDLLEGEEVKECDESRKDDETESSELL